MVSGAYEECAGAKEKGAGASEKRSGANDKRAGANEKRDGANAKSSGAIDAELMKVNDAVPVAPVPKRYCAKAIFKV